MDIDALASEFGSAGVAPATSADVDVHSLAAEFGSEKTANEIEKKHGITIRPVAPPISGPQGETNTGVTVTGGNPPNNNNLTTGENNYRGIEPLVEGIKNLPSAIGTAIKEKALEGRSLASEGIEDISSNKPASGVAKIAGGTLAALTSPLTGTVQETVEKPITQLTGNPDIGNRAGLVAASAIPVARIGSAVVNAIPKNKAFSTLVESIGPENAGSVVSAMRANPRLTPADLSPKVRQDAQNLFVTDGKHINYLANTVEGRLNSAKQAVEGAMNSSLGNTVDAVQKLKDLKQNIREVGQKEINPIIVAKPHTDITAAINDIDKEIGPHVLKALKEGQSHPMLDTTKKELYNIRQQLRANWPDRDKMFSYTDDLHRVQSQTRLRAEVLKNSSNGEDRLASQALFKIREKLKDAVGPEYKAALGKYKDEIDIQDAFAHGHDAILTNSKAIENRPEFFKEWVAKASPEELHAAKEGARVAIDTQINGFKHAARRGTDVGEIEFNRQRIEALFGKTEADKLFTALKHERAIADTNAKLVQGSQTAMRNSSKAAFELPTKTEAGKTLLPAAIVEGANMLSSGVPGVGAALYAGSRVALAAKDRIKLLLAKEHNAQYAKLALPTEGPSRDALIQNLEQVANRNSPKQSILRRGAGTLSRLVGP